MATIFKHRSFDLFANANTQTWTGTFTLNIAPAYIVRRPVSTECTAREWSRSASRVSGIAQCPTGPRKKSTLEGSGNGRAPSDTIG